MTKTGMAGFIGLAILLCAATVAQEARKITGVVQAADSQRPVANAEVRYEERGMATQSTRTDSKGRFEIPSAGRRGGIVTVTARNYGTARRSWPPREGLELKFALTPPSVVTGTLVDAATRQGIEGRVTVVVRHPLNHVSSTAMAALGTFQFDDLPAGPAVVYARAVGFAPHFGTLTVDAGKRVETQIGLLLEAAASGTVLDRGEPVTGSRIHVGYDRSMLGAGTLAGFIRGRVMTNSEGMFRVSGLVPDTTIGLQAELNGRLSDIVTIRAIVPGMEQPGIVLRMQ